MIGELALENFKAWERTGRLRLAPITVLFGPNSSGKSSLNQFLVTLKQTVRSPDRNLVLDLGDASSPVDLGSFRDVVSHHDVEREIWFSGLWPLPGQLQIRDPLSERRLSGSSLRFSAGVRQAATRARATEVTRLAYELLSNGQPALRVAMERSEKRPNRWRLATKGYELVRTKGRPWELPRPSHFYGFPDEALAYYQNTAFLSDLELALERELQAVSYLGPLRRPPQRLYTWSGAEPEDVGWEGENAVQAILSAGDRRLNFQRRARTIGFQEVVARWLQTMGLIAAFRVAPIAPGRDEYEVRVRVTKQSDEVGLTDVGFGVSQVLPVIAQCFYAPASSTVLIEQPEIHLHPGVQASLADLFIAAIRARENGEARNVQLVVESHSEHFLRRLQRRVAETTLTEDDVALYFCSWGEGGASIEQLALDQFGDIANWPTGFFGDELEDVAAQARESIARRTARNR
jgi:predicted ATPase